MTVDAHPGTQVHAGADVRRAGEAATRGLRDALARVGICLPSMHGGTGQDGQGEVDLGTCPAGMATRLAEVLDIAADAVPGLRAPR